MIAEVLAQGTQNFKSISSHDQFIAQCTATVVGSTRSLCELMMKKKRGADGLDLAGLRQGPSLRIRGIRAFGYHILMIGVLAMLSCS